MSFAFNFQDARLKEASWVQWTSGVPDGWPERFVEELGRFLNAYGYRLQEDDRLVERVVMWAWSHAHVALSNPKHRYCIKYPVPIDPTDEEWNWYCHTVSDEAWDLFFERWTKPEWCDEETAIGVKQRGDLHRFVWTLLDLGASPANKHIRTLLDMDEDTEDDVAQPAESHAYGGDRRTY